MAEKTDITFKICNVRVNVRAVAVIVNNGSILFQKRENDPVWALPGGKVAILEKGEQTIQRELEEEIGEKVEVSSLFDVKENFFEYNDEKYHEYMFMYLASLKKDSKLKDSKFFDGIEKQKHLKYAWLNSEELNPDNIVPVEIVDMLKNIIENNQKDVVESRIRR